MPIRGENYSYRQRPEGGAVRMVWSAYGDAPAPMYHRTPNPVRTAGRRSTRTCPVTGLIRGDAMWRSIIRELRYYLSPPRRLVLAPLLTPVALMGAAGEGVLEDFEGVGQVGAAKADADMAGLVVDRAGKQEDAGLGEACAVSGEVTDSGHAGESDGACGRAYPLEGLGVPLEEGVEQRQGVLPDGAGAGGEGGGVWGAPGGWGD